jgi:hypothetical protein
MSPPDNLGTAYRFPFPWVSSGNRYSGPYLGPRIARCDQVVTISVVRFLKEMGTMDRITGGCLRGNVAACGAGTPMPRRNLSLSGLPQASRRTVSRVCDLSGKSVTIEGETRDYAGLFFLPPLRLARFRTQRRRDRSEFRIPRCAEPTGADIRTLDHPPRGLVATVSAQASP